MEGSLSKVSFDRIRYANCWEDADVLLRGLNPNAGSRILSVCSAGDNSLSLLTTDPERVLAVDISQPQLFLSELKIAAFRELEYEEMLAFLGITASHDRLRTFEKLKTGLSSECRGYYERNQDAIAKGVIHTGKFENYFGLFRRFILPLVHRKSVVKQLLAPKTLAEQKEFYDNTWNSYRWRMLFRIFFGRWLMGKLGRDPQFLKQVDIPVAEYLFQRSEMYIGHVDLQKNPYLHFIFTGNYGAHLPHYLRPENFSSIKGKLSKLKLQRAYIQEIKSQQFSHFNLSNIFEYLDPAGFHSSAKTLSALGDNGARYFYWNLMVPRRMSEILPDLFSADSSYSHNAAEDKCFFYRTAIADIRQ